MSERMKVRNRKAFGILRSTMRPMVGNPETNLTVWVPLICKLDKNRARYPKKSKYARIEETIKEFEKMVIGLPNTDHIGGLLSVPYDQASLTNSYWGEEIKKIIAAKWTKIAEVARTKDSPKPKGPPIQLPLF